MINPDAKPGKAARRRAASMETSKYEKKRGRIKKKIEAMRNGTLNIASPGSSVSEGLDVLSGSPLQGFQLSPDFRPRASSNASSYGGGRLSPILAVESDMLLLSLSNGNGLAESESCIPDSRGPMLSQPVTNGLTTTSGLPPHHPHGLPNDLDLDSLQGGLECDVNSVIQHELRLDGNLDFNFDSSSLQANNSAASVATSLASTPNLNWYTELYIQ